jgi:hypothetical protein
VKKYKEKCKLKLCREKIQNNKYVGIGVSYRRLNGTDE